MFVHHLVRSLLLYHTTLIIMYSALGALGLAELVTRLVIRGCVSIECCTCVLASFWSRATLKWYGWMVFKDYMIVDDQISNIPVYY